MTQPGSKLHSHSRPPATAGGQPAPLTVALALAARAVPVLPLGKGKRPVGNCPDCHGNSCGGRPQMKHGGACRCPRPCHAWAAATTDPAVIASPAWAAAWRQAAAVAYHPAGAGLTVVDLDDATAVAWAHEHLPPTRVVVTTRGEHWIYRGAMTSHNRVRPGVDIKSGMAYTRWLGPGHGPMTALPSVVRALAVREETTTRPTGAGVASSSPAQPGWDASVATGCRHTERFRRTGLDKGLSLIAARRDSGAASQAFGVARFLGAQHTECPGPCALDTLADKLTAAAVAVGVPEAYAARAVANGLHAAGFRKAVTTGGALRDVGRRPSFSALRPDLHTKDRRTP